MLPVHVFVAKETIFASVPKLVLTMLSLMLRVLDVTCIRFSMQTLASVLPIQIYTNVLLFVPGFILLSLRMPRKGGLRKAGNFECARALPSESSEYSL